MPIFATRSTKATHEMNALRGELGRATARNQALESRSTHASDEVQALRAELARARAQNRALESRQMEQSARVADLEAQQGDMLDDDLDQRMVDPVVAGGRRLDRWDIIDNNIAKDPWTRGALRIGSDAVWLREPVWARAPGASEKFVARRKVARDVFNMPKDRVEPAAVPDYFYANDANTLPVALRHLRSARSLFENRGDNAASREAQRINYAGALNEAEVSLQLQMSDSALGVAQPFAAWALNLGRQTRAESFEKVQQLTARELQESIEAYPHNATLRVQHARVLEDRRDYGGALLDIEYSMALVPDCLPLMVKRARLLYENRQLTEALWQADRVLSMEPDNLETLVVRGAALRISNLYENWRESAAVFEKLARRFPDNADVKGQLSLSLLSVGDPAAAAEQARAALRQDPTCPYALLTLSAALGTFDACLESVEFASQGINYWEGQGKLHRFSNLYLNRAAALSRVAAQVVQYREEGGSEDVIRRICVAIRIEEKQYTNANLVERSLADLRQFRELAHPNQCTKGVEDDNTMATVLCLAAKGDFAGAKQYRGDALLRYGEIDHHFINLESWITAQRDGASAD